MSWLGTRGWDLKAWKYRVAHLLDKLPWTCGTRLVGWAEYGSPLRASRGLSCRSERFGSGGCYCGKLGGRRAPEPLDEGAPF